MASEVRKGKREIGLSHALLVQCRSRRSNIWQRVSERTARPTNLACSNSKCTRAVAVVVASIIFRLRPRKTRETWDWGCPHTYDVHEVLDLEFPLFLPEPR